MGAANRVTHSRAASLSWDAIIIGGGIAGLGVARALSLKKQKVLVLEKKVQGASSPHASGILDPFVDLDFRPAILGLTIPALREYSRWIRQIESETGLMTGFEKRPLLYTAFSAPDEKKLKRFLVLPGVRQRMKVRWLNRQEVFKKEPSINPRIRGGLYLPETARVYPDKLVHALRAWLIQRGVVFKTISASPRLLIEKNRARGITVSGRSFRAETVIGCLGAWAGLEQGGFRQPVQAVRGELLIYQRKEPLKVLLHTASGGYLIPWNAGQVLAGSTAEKNVYQVKLSRGGKKQIHVYASELLPELKNKKAVRGWAGIRPRSLSGKPRIGKTKISGYYVANGYYRCGILMGIYAGKLLAQLILSGQTPAALRPFELK